MGAAPVSQEGLLDSLLVLAFVLLPCAQVVRRGFTPMMTPDVVREAVFEKCGFQPRGANTQVRARAWQRRSVTAAHSGPTTCRC